MATKIIPFIFFIFFCFKSFSDELIEILDKESNYAELKIVDKITSKIIEKKLKVKTVNKVKDFDIFIDKDSGDKSRIKIIIPSPLLAIVSMADDSSEPFLSVA